MSAHPWPHHVVEYPLNFRQRTLAREIFKRIQQRLPYPTTNTSCPVCEMLFTDNPTCGIHPGLCCRCADAAAKLEHITLSHMPIDRSGLIGT